MILARISAMLSDLFRSNARPKGDETAEMAARLEKALGSTADTWLRMQMNHDLAQAKRRASSIRVKRIEPKVA